MLTTLKKDPDIQKLSPLITSRFKVLGSDDVWENINVETGDFSIFPLSYIAGGAPEGGSAIALSDLNAKELNKRVGDSLLLKAGGKERKLTVSGIYQDITNGGRTAKAQLPYDPKTVMWYVVAVDVLPEIPVAGKIEQWTGAFYPAKITHLDSYLAQTLGNTEKQLRRVTLLAIVISSSIAVLITSLFLKMLLAKDSTQITILRSIGFTVADIRRQYLARTLLVAGLGSLLGILAAGTIGQSLVRVLGSFLGASRIQLEVNPLLAYLILPAGLMLVVAVTTIGSTGLIHKSGFTNKIAD
jgi:putative ABC transport system permease protein